MDQKLKPNRFKAALKAGKRQIGLWNSLRGNYEADIIADVGFDWILVDMEHSPNDIGDVLSHLQALDPGSATPVVRIPWNDAVVIKRVLDIGAMAILVPYVETAEEARKAVAATRYPKAGMRGVALGTRANRYGRVKDYAQRAHEEICVLVQVETKKGLDNIDAIIAVEGVDGVFIGPADLSADLGYLGQLTHPEAQAAIKRAVDACKAKGKPSGSLAFPEADIKRYLDWGVQFMAVGSDAAILARGVEALHAKYADYKDK
ncbi:MAG: HpcH/HpaI aldolase/citrate lyase family protein [Alphaproteobacteria bacterium]|nr:HpcH/HpaI aldolase/citrate lyase family protein [Alphaproteobacteria bacterium]